MLEQTSRAAILCKRPPAREWTTKAQTQGSIALPDLSLVLPLEDIYQRLC